MFFRRVVEQDDSEAQPRNATISKPVSRPFQPRSKSVRFGQPSFAPEGPKHRRDEESIAPETTTKRQKRLTNLKRRLPEGEGHSDSDDEDFRGFVRVTLVSKRRRTEWFTSDRVETFDSAAQKVLRNTTYEQATETSVRKEASYSVFERTKSVKDAEAFVPEETTGSLFGNATSVQGGDVSFLKNAHYPSSESTQVEDMSTSRLDLSRETNSSDSGSTTSSEDAEAGTREWYFTVAPHFNLDEGPIFTLGPREPPPQPREAPRLTEDYTFAMASPELREAPHLAEDYILAITSPRAREASMTPSETSIADFHWGLFYQNEWDAIGTIRNPRDTVYVPLLPRYSKGAHVHFDWQRK